MTVKLHRKQVNILGIGVDSTSMEEVLTKVTDFIKKNTKFFIVTPNPEIILASTRDAGLRTALNAADICLPDGVGLRLADPALEIIHGRKLFMELVWLAASKGWRVFLLGGLSGVAAAASRKLKTRNPKLKINYDSGPKLDQQANPVSEKDIKIEIDTINKINNFKPDLLFVAFGAPKQEKWVYKHLKRLDIGGAIVVGGAIDYLTGTVPLPPAWMEKLELEWLWRLFTQPFRFRRIFNAVIVFPASLILEKCKKLF